LSTFWKGLKGERVKKIKVLWTVGAERIGLDKPWDAITGAQATTLEILRNIDTSRFSMYLAIDGYSPLEEEYKKHSKIVPFKTRWQFDNSALNRLGAVIHKERIDIIHTQGMRRAFLCFLLGQKAGLTKILTRHSAFCDIYYPRLKKLVYDPFDRCSSKATDVIITVAEYVKRRIVETRGINPEKIRVIYNGINADRFDPDRINPVPIRNSLCIPRDAKVVTTVASLVEGKGHKYLFKAAVEILKKIPNTIFLLVGDGYYKERLKKIIKEYKLNRSVIFAGFRRDVESILKISDMLVLPSLSEGFPIVILEAMAMRNPVVATNISGIPEMVDEGKDGFLVSPRDSVELASRICEILKDKNLSDLMGKNGRMKILEKFTGKRMSENYEVLYSEFYQKKQRERYE